jgi:hypothetical protein
MPWQFFFLSEKLYRQMQISIDPQKKQTKNYIRMRDTPKKYNCNPKSSPNNETKNKIYTTHHLLDNQLTILVVKISPLYLQINHRAQIQWLNLPTSISEIRL